MLHEDKHIFDYIRLKGDSYIISEGLIKTYPIEKVIENLSQVLKLSTDIEMYNKITTNVETNYKGIILYNKGRNDAEVVDIIVPESVENKGLLDKYLNKYGYFMASKISLDVVKDVRWAEYRYEKKYNIDVTDLCKGLRYLYHICSQDIWHKIEKQGLTPRLSQWDNFENPERIYFFIHPMDKDEFEYWCNDFDKHKKEKRNYYLLRIDLNEYVKLPTFYVDPRMKNGVYTMENIKPSSIKIINKFKNS